MRHSRLLELIWQGDIRPTTGRGARRMQRALSALLPLRAIVLVEAQGIDASFVLTDTTELLPEVALGDVLAEELDLDVPAGSLVVFGAASLFAAGASAEALSQELGLLVADTLLGVIGSGTFPLARETDALYAMASAYDSFAGGAEAPAGLVPEPFRAGLATALCRYWTGSRGDDAALSPRPDFLTCAPLLAYLRQLDGNFTAPDRIPGSLMHFVGAPSSYEVWLFKIWCAVTARFESEEVRSGEAVPEGQLRLHLSRKN